MNPMSKNPQDKEAGKNVSGEGNYEATHRYNAGVEASVQKGDAEELAKKAKKALEGPEGDDLRQAEEKGKQGGTT